MVANAQPRMRTRVPFNTRSAIITTAIVALVLFYPLFDTRGLGVQPDVAISTLADAGVYIMLALGLNIVIGYAGLLDLGYAAFFAIGSYTYALLASPRFGVHLSFWLIIGISAVVAATFGVILGAPTLRLRGDYLAIVTLGFGEIVPTVFLNLEPITGGTNGISGVDKPVLGIPGTDIGIVFAFDPRPYYYLVIVMLFLIIIAITRLRDSRVGRAWMAIREDELAAAAMGIDTVRTKLLAFGLGAAFSGFAGCVYASKLGFIGPQQFDFNVSVFILCMIILGGLGTIRGVIVGALILYVMQSYVLTQLPTFLRNLGEDNNIEFLAKTDFSGLRYLIYGVALVSMMLIRPEGLLPNERRKAELHPESDELAERENESELFEVLEGTEKGPDTRGKEGPP